MDKIFTKSQERRQKLFFYKNVWPNKSFNVPTGIVFHSNYVGSCETLEYYNPDDLQLGEKEMKMLKTKFNPTKIISPDELRNTFLTEVNAYQ